MKSLAAKDSALQKHKKAVHARRRRESKASEAGAVCRVEIVSVKAGLHETAEGIKLRPIYRISWRRKPFLLFGRGLLGARVHSERFVKLPPERINVPPEADLKCGPGGDTEGIEERAVFLSTCLADASLKTIFAVRNKDSWLGLYEWRASWSDLSLSRLEVCNF